VCAVSEALCLISDRHYTESVNCLVSDEENGRCVLWGASPMSRKGRCTLWERVSYLRKRETHIMGGASPFYLTPQKILSTKYSSRDAPYTSTQRARWHTYTHACVPTGTLRDRRKKHHVEYKLFEIFEALRLPCV
jgi:hypothetical protein